MTDQLDTASIRAQMAALSGFAQGPWKVNPTDDTTVITHDRNMVAEIDGDYNEPDLWPVMEANARLIAAAPTMRATILALCDALEAARAENELLRAEISRLTAQRDVAVNAMVRNHQRAEKAEAERDEARAALAQKEEG